MGKLALEQINGILSAPLRVTPIAGATGASTTVTTPITTALATAGKNGVSVPLQPSAASGLGLITTAPLNRIEISDATTKLKLKDASSNEVYARLTEAGGVYTITYFVLVNGVETAYSIPSATNLDIDITYRFDLGRLPVDAFTAYGIRVVQSDPTGGGAIAANWFAEVLTVTATNTLSALTKTPTNVSVMELVVNGKVHDSLGGANADFALSGTPARTVTWNSGSAAADYSIVTGMKVVAFYQTFE